MHYNYFILITILILGTSGNALSKITPQGFPKSTADITVSQSMDLHSDGYLTYKDAPAYHQINISAPERVTQQPSIQGTVSPDNSTYNTPVTQQEQINNNESISQQNPNGNTQQHTPERPQEPPQHQNPQVPQTPQQPQNNSERGICFTKDIQNPKRYIPPRVTNARAYWWVGDSRFTGMYINGVIGRKNDEAVVAHAGRGHEWFTKTPTPTGMSLLETCLRDGDVVILNLGANDIWKHDSYISTYRNLMSNYPNVTFKIVSVNPVCDSKARLKNTKIETFNTHIKNAFPSNFIDTYSIVKPRVNESNTDSEGLHYRGGGIEQTIYDTVMHSVGNN